MSAAISGTTLASLPDIDGAHMGFARCYRNLTPLGTEDFLGREETVQRCGKPRIDSHLHQYFRDLFTRETDIEARLDVDLQLRRRISHCRKRRDRCDLPVAHTQSWP